MTFTKKVLRPVISPTMRGAMESGRGGTPGLRDQVKALAPLGLYDASADDGVWQVSDGTVAVTATSDPVGRLTDFSGNGYHLLNVNSADRVIFNESGGLRWIAGDGISKWLGNLDIRLTTTNTIVVACQLVNSPSDKYLLSVNLFNTAIRAITAAQWRSNTEAGALTQISTSTGSPEVLTLQRTSNSLLSGRLNGVAQQSFDPFDQTPNGLALFTQQTVSWSTGGAHKVYGLAAFDKILSASELAIVEEWATALITV